MEQSFFAALGSRRAGTYAQTGAVTRSKQQSQPGNYATGTNRAASFADILENARAFAATGSQNARIGAGGESPQSDSACAPVLCELTIKGRTFNIGDDLQAIAKDDFGRFIELLEQLKSCDADSMLDALANICGVERGTIQQTLENMDDDQLRQFAGSLSKVVGTSATDTLLALREIQESTEFAGWAEDKSEKKSKRNAAGGAEGSMLTENLNSRVNVFAA